MNAERVAAAAGRAAVIAAAVLTVAAVLAAARYRADLIGLGLAVIAVTFLPVPLVGAAMVRARPGNQAGWTLLAAGVGLPIGVTGYIVGHSQFSPWAGWFDAWPWTPALTLVPTVGLLLFPDGRLPSKRWRPVLWAGWAVNIAQLIYALFAPTLLDFPDRANPTALPGSAGAVANGLGVTIALVAPLSTLSAVAVHRRWRRDRDRALSLVVPAGWLIAASWWTCALAVTLTGDSDKALAAEVAGLFALAVTAWVAIRRYGLFDGRQVVNRTLVYAALSVLVLAVYLGVAAAVGSFAADAVSGPVAVVAAVLVALPLRGMLQRAANRLVYGYRDEPAGALAHLGARLRGAAAADEILPGVAATVRAALRLPYVRIDVAGGSVTAGSVVPATDDLPLVFAGETIGVLTVGRREADRPFGAGEWRLLTDVAQQVAAAGHAVRLSSDLQRSRERLIAATEEERRRIRRDLHDGLGPTLAGVVLGLQRARVRSADPGVAAQLDTLTGQTREAIAEVRRLVYDLRPPALDELGLVGALDEQARTLGPITVTGPAGQHALPAAVEVAAYRIAMEAMTNVIRHAHARAATVHLTVDGSLRLEVTDDGDGLPPLFRAGVGIASMRERATELGGTCTIEPGHLRGTRVFAVLPLEPR